MNVPVNQFYNELQPLHSIDNASYVSMTITEEVFALSKQQQDVKKLQDQHHKKKKIGRHKPTTVDSVSFWWILFIHFCCVTVGDQNCQKVSFFCFTPKSQSYSAFRIKQRYLGRLTTPWGPWAPHRHTTPRFPEAMYLRTCNFIGFLVHEPYCLRPRLIASVVCS